jgi:class 3 adenylate cyclase
MAAMLRSPRSNVDPMRDTWAVKYATRLAPAIHSGHAVLPAFIGDAIMAVFGIPTLRR